MLAPTRSAVGNRRFALLGASALVALASVFALGFLSGSTPSQASEGALVAVAAQQPETAHHPDLARLHSRLNQLELRLRAQETADANQEVEESREAPPEPTTTREDHKARLERYEDVVAQAAAAQPSDSAWSQQVARGYQERISELSLPVVFEAARCGLDLCVLSFTHEAPDVHMQVLRGLNEPSPKAPGPAVGFGGPALIRRHPRPDGGFKTTLYFTKIGGTLPPMEK